ncbi:hypothetical protein, partial [Streptomyces sp. NPDC059742]
MRVLFVTSPLKSVFQYMVPLAWALRTAGHEVRVATQPSFTDTVTQAGLTAVPVGRRRNPDRMLDLLDPSVIAESRRGLPPPWDAVEDPAKRTWEELVRGYAQATESLREENFPVVAPLVDFCRHWQPDLVLWEPYSVAGPIAAKACGAAHARVLFGVDVFGSVRQLFLRLLAEQPSHARRDPLAEWLGGYARKYGGEYSEDMATGHFTVDPFPASLQVEGVGLRYERMQWVGYGGPAVVPRWLWGEPERPRVVLTMGLSATDVFSGYTVNTGEVLGAFEGLDVEVVATVAESEWEGLGRVPG